jgi:multidrug resistance efflux pump
MKAFCSHVLLSAAAVCTCLSVGITQQQATNEVPGTDEALRQKVEQLEVRIKRLERVLFPTSQLSVSEAERRLTEAEQTLEQSKRLLRQGLVSKAQIEHDEFMVAQARLEIKLAKSDVNKEQFSAKLDLVKAQQAVDQASRELDYARKLANRGYTSKYEVQRRERVLRDLERELEIAQQKLKLFEPDAPADPEKPQD